ncbi:hypothetical protein E2320_014001 [Naja naja]|nr:hypothetical protein E2320_014001 [Naja naja]
MSRLLRAFTEMIEGNSKVPPRKSTDAELLKKSEFKTLIQKELTPSKRTRKPKNTKLLHESDTELMNEKELTGQWR